MRGDPTLCQWSTPPALELNICRFESRQQSLHFQFSRFGSGGRQSQAGELGRIFASREPEKRVIINIIIIGSTGVFIRREHLTVLPLTEQYTMKAYLGSGGTAPPIL
jgi:hypothetical protein